MNCDSCGKSHPGNVRFRNEDSFVDKPELGLYVVADGLGGGKAGHRASRTVVNVLVREFEKSGVAAARNLANAVVLANTMILTTARTNRDCTGMATTVTALVLEPPMGYAVSVGDSRLYRLRGDELSCLTKDDSWAVEIAKPNGATEESIAEHPFRHVLTKAIGGKPQVEFEVDEIELEPGDLFLLCSDGLYGVVEEDMILDVMRTPASLEGRCEALIGVALSAGGPDNITALLVECRGEKEDAGSKSR